MTGASIAQWQNLIVDKCEYKSQWGNKVFSFDMPKIIGSCASLKRKDNSSKSLVNSIYMIMMGKKRRSPRFLGMLSSNLAYNFGYLCSFTGGRSRSLLERMKVFAGF